jgi:hypothetical protein
MKGWQTARAFPGRNRIFTAAALLAVAVRVVVMLAFRPALWFGGDSASYLAVALRLRPDASRVAGYGLMLLILRPLHSVAVVVAVQHVLGLAAGLGIYLLLRERFRLPAWGATLAAAPVLFDAYQLELEHEILSDIAFEFLVVAALIVALWSWRDSPAWADVTAGALLAGAVIIRPVGLPLLLIYLCYLLLRRVRWRVFGLTLAACALPLACYLGWFYAAFHVVGFARSDGIFLWGRTMSFANCTVIKPPPEQAALCPDGTGPRLASSSYVWVPQSPLNAISGPRFSARKNDLALGFALRAITAQPGGYATAVLHDFMLSFYWQRPPHPSSYTASKYQFAAAQRVWVSPELHTPGGGTVRGDQRLYAGAPAPTRAYEPYAGFARAYQRYVYLPGTLLGVILLIGLAAIVRSWRGGGGGTRGGWGGPGLLPWLGAASLLVVPVATTDFDLRYVVPAVPLACLAAALAAVRADQAPPPAVPSGLAGRTIAAP